MKKALLILLVLSIVGAAAFADVKFGAFAAIGMRADYIMNKANTTTNVDSLYAWEWFQGTPLIGLATASFVGADPNMGFDTRFIAVGGSTPLGLPKPLPSAISNTPAVDYANAWMKVANGMVALNLGLFQASEDFETAENAWGQNTWNSGFTPAFTAYAYPIEGLTIGYQLPLQQTNAQSIADALYGSKVGVRYTMKDVFGATAGYLMGKGDGASNAYFGVSVSAIPSLGLWFEGLMVNIGSKNTAETDLYVEANYPVMESLKVGVAAAYDIVTDAAGKSGFVAEPYAIYTVMENFNLMLGVDIGTVNWGWYGLQNGGAALAGDGLQWDVFVRASMMSPLGELRIQAKYGAYNTAVTTNASSYFNVFAGVKWGF
jgi:hypothetical protein